MRLSSSPLATVLLLLSIMLLQVAATLHAQVQAHSLGGPDLTQEGRRLSGCSRSVALRGDNILQASVECSSSSVDVTSSSEEKEEADPGVDTNQHEEAAHTNDASVQETLSDSLPNCEKRMCSESGQCSYKGHVCVCHATEHSFSVACSS
jgi:hypothetical protein